MRAPVPYVSRQDFPCAIEAVHTRVNEPVRAAPNPLFAFPSNHPRISLEERKHTIPSLRKRPRIARLTAASALFIDVIGAVSAAAERTCPMAYKDCSLEDFVELEDVPVRIANETDNASVMPHPDWPLRNDDLFLVQPAHQICHALYNERRVRIARTFDRNVHQNVSSWVWHAIENEMDTKSRWVV